MTTEITNSEDMIDSRDVIERIGDLVCIMEDDDATADEIQELHHLEALQEEAKPYAEDWEYGESLIRGSYFTHYAQELANDIGCIDDEHMQNWPFTCIDWDRAARELQMDYTEVEFDGVAYFIR